MLRPTTGLRAGPGPLTRVSFSESSRSRSTLHERSTMANPWSKQLRKKPQRGYPVGTVAFYGPDDRRATKVAVGIVPAADEHVTELERWFNEDLDVRLDPKIGNAVLTFLRRHTVRSVVVTDGIFGCPHEEGIDYPVGKECPACPFWAGRDRFLNGEPA